jgi:hypothetical protein
MRGCCGILVARRNARREGALVNGSSGRRWCQASSLACKSTRICRSSASTFGRSRRCECATKWPRVLDGRRPPLIELIESAGAIFHNLVVCLTLLRAHAELGAGVNRRALVVERGSPNPPWPRPAVTQFEVNIVLNNLPALSLADRRKSQRDNDLRHHLMPLARESSAASAQLFSSFRGRPTPLWLRSN